MTKPLLKNASHIALMRRHWQVKIHEKVICGFCEDHWHIDQVHRYYHVRTFVR